MNLIVHLCLLLTLSTPVKKLRSAYFNAAQNANALPALKNLLDHYSSKDQYFYCYLSAYNSLSSRYSTSLSKKMEYFHLCKKQMEQSLQLGESFDAHFIRFCIQSKTPGLLKYKSELGSDKKFILQNLKAEANDEYKQKVKDFLKTCNTLNPVEKAEVERL